MGISWGGFNGLQLAALQPPELQALVKPCQCYENAWGVSW
jgi:uncharacterized protein